MIERVSVSEFHTLHGLRLHIRRWPAPGRPKVVLLHGWMDCGAGFNFWPTACTIMMFMLPTGVVLAYPNTKSTAITTAP